MTIVTQLLRTQEATLKPKQYTSGYLLLQIHCATNANLKSFAYEAAVDAALSPNGCTYWYVDVVLYRNYTIKLFNMEYYNGCD